MSRYVYRPGHPQASQFGFVDVALVGGEQIESKALDAPVLVGRFYENVQSPIEPEKVINSRRQYNDHLKQHGATNSSDYKETWAKKEEERAKAFLPGQTQKPTGYDAKSRREDIGRAIYELQQQKRRG